MLLIPTLAPTPAHCNHHSVRLGTAGKEITMSEVLGSKSGDLHILVEAAGQTDIQEFIVHFGARLGELVTLVAMRNGFPPVGALLFIEDAESPMDLDLIFDERYDYRRIHHVHHAKSIEVIVYYNGADLHKDFAPSTRISTVLTWATGPRGFKIDPAISPEMQLQIVGSQVPLQGKSHIGRYVPHNEHVLKLDLTRGVIPNGALL
jgi:hypothetical protein